MKLNKNNMTQLTYKIVHIKVSAEDYWTEVKNSDFYRIAITPDGSELIELDFTRYDECYITRKNDNHPLSTLANDLGAIVYGGFMDEKDFYLLLPTMEKVGTSGNIYIDEIVDEYDKYEPWVSRVLIKKLFTVNNEPRSTVVAFSSRDGKDFRCDSDCMSRVHYEIYRTPKGNIFQEYARTGIIENDFYKQFFK